MLLAIDVGNTEIKAGLWDGARWESLVRGPLPATDEDAIAFLERLPGWPHETICCSVVPKVDEYVCEAARALHENQVHFLSAQLPLGVEIKYKTPTSLGADRLANALGLLALAANGIVVDAGTATKVEAIAGGAYLGGAILPGMEMGAKALASETAQLPKLDLALPEQLIGTDTVTAMLSGVVHGQAAAIDGMVERFRQEIESAGPVLITGGHSELLVPLCRTSPQRVPTLTLDGLVEAAKRLGL